MIALFAYGKALLEFRQGNLSLASLNEVLSQKGQLGVNQQIILYNVTLS